MGATRKLQGEIDKVLKKVQEGVDVFDSIWNKVYDTENANQKEKFEADLKKEIKKLQRHRDQIKTWLQSSEIKDKKALLDARKQIEREMERFKVCEKETKTKAFSKEGLGQQPKTDPREKAKVESRDWLNNMVGELESQVDSFEAELEGLPVKKGKTKPPRLVRLEEFITRHKAHIIKLEQILRLLDNDEVSPEQVNDAKESVEDYVERNQESFEDFDDVDALYGSVLLEKIEALENMDAISNVTSVLIAKDKGTKESFQPPQVLDDNVGSSATESGLKTPSAQDVSIGSSFSGFGSTPANSAVNEAREIGVGSPTSVLSVKVNKSSNPSLPSSPVSFSSAVKEEEASSYLGRSGSLSRSVGRGPLTNSGSPGQSPSLVSAALTTNGLPSSGISAVSGVVGGSPLPDLSKRASVLADERLSSGVLAQQLTPPSSSQSRVFLPGGSKLADAGLDAGSSTESGIIANRLFASSGGQWRSPSSMSFQSQEPGQFLGRTEIAPDQKQKFLQRLQQVNPLLASTQPISQLGTSQKPQSQLQLLQNQHVSLLQASQNAALTQQQTGVPLGMQNQAVLNGAPQSLTSVYQQGLATPQLPTAQQIVFTAGSSGKDNDSASSKMGDVSQQNPQHKLQEDVAGPGTLAELSRLSNNVDSASQPVQPIQSSGGPGIIGRRSGSDLGAIGDNLTSSAACDQMYNLQMLEAAFHRLPLPKDSEQSKNYTPRHPALTPSSYPQTPAELIDNPAFWERLDPDVLFYSFYYQQGTYQQYLAARELKKQSWRYHKKYNTWFQRHEEPKVTTDEYEQGTYVYFDFHIVHDDFQQGWCQRIKTEFTFEYSYLEDELVV